MSVCRSSLLWLQFLFGFAQWFGARKVRSSLFGWKSDDSFHYFAPLFIPIIHFQYEGSRTTVRRPEDSCVVLSCALTATQHNTHNSTTVYTIRNSAFWLLCCVFGPCKWWHLYGTIHWRTFLRHHHTRLKLTLEQNNEPQFTFHIGCHVTTSLSLGVETKQ